MQQNKLNGCFAILLLLTQLTTQAQNKNETILVTSKGVHKTDLKSTSLNSLDDVRKQVMSSFNLLRDYSITVDTISTKAMDDEEVADVIIKDASPTYFKQYLSNMDATLRKRLETMSELPNTHVQQEKLNKQIVMLKSYDCFSRKEKGVFIWSKDKEGNAIISFPIDSLRKKSRYGLVDNYTEGYARIQKDQVFGFLNLCGEEAVICQYEKAEPFNQGMALVRRIDWMFVDTKGTESNPLENVVDARNLGYGISLFKFSNNTFAIVNNDYPTTKMPLSSFYESIEPFFKKEDAFKVRNGKKFGIIGQNGKVKLDPIYDDIVPANEEDIFRINLEGRFGLVDANWEIQYTPIYNSISDFNEFGIATATNEKGSILIHKKGLIKSKTYEDIGEFNEFGIAVIREGNKSYGLIDTNFRVVVEPIYASIGSFNDMGLAPACLTTNKCGFIKYDGTEQIKANYESVTPFNTFGLAVAKVGITTNYKGVKNEKIFAPIIIDTQGNTIVPVTDEVIEKKISYELSDSLHSEAYIIVNAVEEKNRLESRFHLIKKGTNQLITSTPYQTITALDVSGNFRVKKDNLWGLLDSTGKLQSKCQFSQIQRVSEDFYAVQNKGGKWGFITSKGKQQIPCEYDEVKNFRNGYATVSKGKGKWGLISGFNAKVIPCVFKSINDKGIKYEVIDQEGLVYIVNEEGECETNCPKFEAIRGEANKATAVSTLKK